jgi:methionyl aminopeptidase
MINPQNRQYFIDNGRRIAAIRDQLANFAQSHPNLADIDHHAEILIKQAGGEPAFAKVPGYRWATCININDQVVHHIPKGRLHPGDVVTLDTGMFFQGTTTDTATSFVICEATPAQTAFLKLGKTTLDKAIKQAKIGHTVRDISETIQKHIEAAGCSVVRTLTGHGLGTTMHEEPQIPCFVSPDPALKTKLREGMVLAIEVMYMEGDWPLVQDTDGWTLRTADGSLSAVFEDDVLLTRTGPLVITQP